MKLISYCLMLCFFTKKCYNNVIYYKNQESCVMNWSKIIKQLRNKLLLTQVEFAEMLDVSFATINRWELGKTTPSKKAIAILDIFCKENNINLKEVI